MAYLIKLVVKSDFLIFGCHGNRSRAKNDLQLPLTVSLTFDKDIWVKKKSSILEKLWNDGRNKPLLHNVYLQRTEIRVAMETAKKS